MPTEIISVCAYCMRASRCTSTHAAAGGEASPQQRSEYVKQVQSQELASLVGSHHAAAPVCSIIKDFSQSEEQISEYVFSSDPDLPNLRAEDNKNRRIVNQYLEKRRKRSKIGKRLCSIAKYPYQMFKRNIINSSSVVRRLQHYDHDIHNSTTLRAHTVSDAERRRRRERMPSFYGGAEVLFRTVTINGDTYEPTRERAKETASYYRMRRKVMSRAGPTRAQLSGYRSRLRGCLVPARFHSKKCGAELRTLLREHRACAPSTQPSQTNLRCRLLYATDTPFN